MIRNKAVLLLAFLANLIWGLTGQAQTHPTTNLANTTVVVALHGQVDDYTRDALKRKFAQARKLGATTIILDLDTPGGLVTAGLDISLFLRNQTDIHTIAYVHPKAYSAGAMIAVACDEIVMSPAAVVGDCAPIVFNTDGHLEAMPAAERAKAQSPVVNDFDGSASRNGYDRKLLESMVITERIVHYVQSPTGEKRFVDETEYPQLLKENWKPVAGLPDPIDGADTLFTTQTDEAIKLGLAKGVAASAVDLAQQRGLNIIADLTPGGGEQFVEVLANPAIRGLLITIFMTTLYISLASPGHGAAEATAILTFGLLVGIPFLTGYATWWEVAAIFAGLALVAFEIFVFPGHGIAAAVGLILMLGGLLMTFVGPEPSGLPGHLPALGQTYDNLKTGLYVVTGGFAGSMLLGFWLRHYLPKLPYFSKLILTATSGNLTTSHSDNIEPKNVWPGVGTEGVAATDLRPGGSARFLDLSLGDTRLIAVVSDGEYVSAGSKLVVRESKGNRVLVSPVTT